MRCNPAAARILFSPAAVLLLAAALGVAACSAGSAARTADGGDEIDDLPDPGDFDDRDDVDFDIDDNGEVEPDLPPGDANIVFSPPEVLDFGAVPLRRGVRGEVRVRNQGSTPINIVDVSIDNVPDQSSFGVSGLPTFPIVLRPDGSLLIEIEASPQTPGVKSAPLRITFDRPIFNGRPSKLIELRIQYKGDTRIEVNPNAVNFGSVRVGASPACQSLTVKNFPLPSPDESNKVLKISSVDFSTPVASRTFTVPDWTGSEIIVPPSESAEVRVCCRPTADGPVNARLQIQTDAGRGWTGDTPDGAPPDDPGVIKGLVEIPLSCSGVLPKLIVVPGSPEGQGGEIDFGQVFIGSPTPTTRRLEFKNVGGAPVTIQSIDLVPPADGGSAAYSLENCSAVGALLSAGASEFCTISYAPSVPSIDLNTIRVRSSDPTNPNQSIVVRGRGVTSSLRWEPQVLDFGQVVVGQSTELPLTIRNLGTATIQLLAVQFPNTTDFALRAEDQLLLPFTLGPSGVQPFRIVFAPGSEGPKTASLLITTNDPTTPTITISLIGQGAAPHLRYWLDGDSGPPNSATIVDFGEVRIGDTATKVIFLQNDGFAALEVFSLRLGANTSGEFGFSPEAFQPIRFGEQARRLEITFSPRRVEGERTGSFRFQTNDALPANRDIQLVLRGFAIDPKISVQPVTTPQVPYRFQGVYARGESAPQCFQVRNVGSGVLELRSLVKGFGNDAQFGVDTMTLRQAVSSGGDTESESEREQFRDSAVTANDEGVFLNDQGRPQPVRLRSFRVYADEFSFCVVYRPGGQFQVHRLQLVLASNDLLNANTPVYLEGQGEPCPEGRIECDNRPAWCETICNFEGRELCDGRDNNCNCEVDEGFDLFDAAGQPQRCSGIPNSPCVDGVRECNRADASKAVCSTHPGGSRYSQFAQLELCDGIDNDCDGQTDNGSGFYTYRGDPTGFKVGDLCVTASPSPTCGLGRIECRTGTDLRCSADQGGSTFAGTPERCNELDDNCNGQVDEGNFPLSSDPSLLVRKNDVCRGTGACNDQQGTYICNGNDRDRLSVTCTVNIGGGAGGFGFEFCDNIDNNCNGRTDEGDFITPDGGTAKVGDPCTGRGVCATRGAGKWACDPKSRLGVVCDTELTFGRPERCNRLDDDCDGQVDEGTWRWPTGNNAQVQMCAGDSADCSNRLVCFGPGSCGQGTFECNPNDSEQNTVICSSEPGGSNYGGSIELCNGRDDNCNQQIDEGFNIGSVCQGNGVCGIGRLECAGDGLGTRCDVNFGGSNYQGRAELCNGLDDDCDGLTDEDFGVGTFCEGKGECGPGVWQCKPGSVFERICSTEKGGRDDRTRPEICDGRDNDCDGTPDEDFNVGAPCTGRGECGPGTIVCVGQSRSGCSTDETSLPTYAGVPEVCDSLDNNCNGQIDEGFDLFTDLNNCGRCRNRCTTPNATPACVQGGCSIAACGSVTQNGLTQRYVDLDGDWRNGCECLDEPTVNKPSNQCSAARRMNPYTILDDGSQVVTVTNLVGGRDAQGTAEVHWHTFLAVDSADTSSNRFNLQVAFTKNPNNQYRFKILQQICDENSSTAVVCPNGTAFSFNLSLDPRNPANTGRGENPCVPRIDRCSGTVGALSAQCEGQTYSAADAQLNWCNEWSTRVGGSSRQVQFFVKVYRDPTRPPTCEPYELTVVNNRTLF